MEWKFNILMQKCNVIQINIFLINFFYKFIYILNLFKYKFKKIFFWYFKKKNYNEINKKILINFLLLFFSEYLKKY